MVEHGTETNKILRIEMQWEEIAFRAIALLLSIYSIVKQYLKSRRQATLHGKVTNRLTGAPIEGMVVTCKGAKGLYTAITSDDGSYRLEGLPPGKYTVMVMDPQGRYEPQVL